MLGCVTIELDREEIRLVATDRYQLAMRTLRPDFVDGGHCQVLVEVSEICSAASWAKGRSDIGLELDGHGLRLRADGQELALTAVDESFPTIGCC